MLIKYLYKTKDPTNNYSDSSTIITSTKIDNKYCDQFYRNVGYQNLFQQEFATILEYFTSEHYRNITGNYYIKYCVDLSKGYNYKCFDLDRRMFNYYEAQVNKFVNDINIVKNFIDNSIQC